MFSRWIKIQQSLACINDCISSEKNPQDHWNAAQMTEPPRCFTDSCTSLLISSIYIDNILNQKCGFITPSPVAWDFQSSFCVTWHTAFSFIKKGSHSSTETIGDEASPNSRWISWTARRNLRVVSWNPRKSVRCRKWTENEWKKTANVQRKPPEGFKRIWIKLFKIT